MSTAHANPSQAIDWQALAIVMAHRFRALEMELAYEGWTVLVERGGEVAIKWQTPAWALEGWEDNPELVTPKYPQRGEESCEEGCES